MDLVGLADFSTRVIEKARWTTNCYITTSISIIYTLDSQKERALVYYDDIRQS